MTLHRKRGRIVFECDADCGEELDTDTALFEVAQGELRAEHWVTRKAGDAWQHYCATCAPRPAGRRWVQD